MRAFVNVDLTKINPLVTKCHNISVVITNRGGPYSDEYGGDTRTTSENRPEDSGKLFRTGKYVHSSIGGR